MDGGGVFHLVRSARSPKCFDDSHVVNRAALYSSFTLDLFGSFVFSIFSLVLCIAALVFDFYLSVLWFALGRLTYLTGISLMEV